MSQGIQLVSSTISGYGPGEGRCLLCAGVPGGAANAVSYSYRDLKPFPQVKLQLKSPVFLSKRTSSLVCTASSSGYRRNPDPRQNRQTNGFSRSTNRQTSDKGNFGNYDDSEMLSSKNGTLSSSPRSQPTAAPGQREREIIELFRKVQAKLRERTTVKEEKNKVETSPEQAKESETLGSLLKLLRKHTVEGRKKSSTGSRDAALNQPEQNVPSDEEQNSGSFSSNNSVREERQVPNANPSRRPISNFRRNSPVPRVKFQPIYTSKEKVDSVPVNSQGRRKNEVEPEPEPELESELDSDSELELEPEHDPDNELEPFVVTSDVHDEVFAEMSDSESSDVDDAYNDDVTETESSTQHTDLDALRITELKELAKSRGLKGYSKMKKADLIELLSEHTG